MEKDLRVVDMVKALVLTGYGINCDIETAFAFKAAGGTAKRVHINDIIKNHDILKDYQILAFPGGFSFGDDIASGKVLANKIKSNNIEFRLGEIEHLPVADQSIDVIMSNCVINLSPEKQQVFQEAFRVLKPGGRLAVSDIVATATLPEEVQKDLSLVAACVGGGESIENIDRMLHQVGFRNVKIQPNDDSRTFIRKWVQGRSLEDYIVSATIEAKKPLK